MKKIKQLIELFNFVKNFLLHDIWRISHMGISPIQSLLVKQLKIFIITFRGFLENKVSLRASALTYYTLLSVVPIVAMAFGIAKGFGFDKVLEQELSSKLSGQEDVVSYIITFANSMLQKTKGGLVAGIGLVLLFWSVMKVLGNIEASFNDIWQIKKGRSFFRKFSDYLSIMLIAPIFIFLSSSVTVYITTQVVHITQQIDLLGFFSPVIFFLVKLIPYVLIWILFSFIYIVMPNTKVKFSSGIIAGIIAGTVFQVTQWLYVKFQIGVSNYNAIYGSFAALPLFMIWMQTAWLIVLFGAEMSFATQNYEKYEYENEVAKISPKYKQLLSLLIVQYIVKKFARHEKAPEIDDISHNLKIPSRITREILNVLTEARIISEVNTNNELEECYQPAVDINSITIKYVIDKLDSVGIGSLDIANVEEMDTIKHKLNSFSVVIDISAENILLKDV
jgi:membrane protein